MTMTGTRMTYVARAGRGVEDAPAIHLGPTLVRWAAILASGVVGVGLLLLLSAFWVALASDNDHFADNLEWYGVLSAFVALAIAGFLSGFLSGLRGVGPGMLNGLTTWGLVATIALLIGAPSALATFDASGGLEAIDPGSPSWATFWALAIGAVTAVVAGALGGMVTRPAELYEVMPDRDEDIDLRNRERGVTEAQPGHAESDPRYSR